MTMRRISVLLVAVVMMLTLAMGTALAHRSGSHVVCIERSGKPDIEIRNLTHNQRENILDRRANAVKGECDGGHKNKNLGQFIAGVTAGRF